MQPRSTKPRAMKLSPGSSTSMITLAEMATHVDALSKRMLGETLWGRRPRFNCCQNRTTCRVK